MPVKALPQRSHMASMKESPTGILEAFAMPVGGTRSLPCMPRIRVSLPPAPLIGLVEGFGLYEMPPETHAAYHCYRQPEGRCALMFLRRRCAPAWTRLVLAGPRDQYAMDPFQGAEIGVLVLLEPGAAGWIAGIPARTLRNRLIPLEELWGDEARQLHQQLAMCDDEQAQAILSDTLTVRPRGQWTPVCLELVRHMERHAGTITVSHLARHGGYSPRHLRRMFDQQVGLTPKLLLRIVRLRAVIAASRFQAKPDWTSLASLAGYTDQSHLIADCLRFTGITPSRLTAHRNLGMILNHEVLFVTGNPPSPEPPSFPD